MSGSEFDLVNEWILRQDLLKQIARKLLFSALKKQPNQDLEMKMCEFL